MVELLSAETILYGILGMSCLCSIVIIMYIIRNYRLIEQHHEEITDYNKRIIRMLEELAQENKKK